MRNKIYHLIPSIVMLTIGAFITGAVYAQDDDTTRKVLKEGLLGAGTGAIAAGASGGRAGEGALIGAGTGVIGSVLLDAITTPSRPAARRRVVQQAPQAAVQDDYYDDESEDVYYEEAPPQESTSSKVLKQGLLGAGTGAIAAGVSGGDAGKGALIGAGTGAVGGILLDAITQPSAQPRRVYRKAAPQRTAVTAPQRVVTAPQQNVQVSEESAGPEGGRKKIVKKYDESGKLVSEEEIYY